MTSTGYMPVRSNAPVTLPEGFHFQTDRRLKNQSQNSKDSTAKDFTKCLRDALPHSNVRLNNFCLHYLCPSYVNF